VTGARITAKLDDVALLAALGRLRQVATVNIGMMRAIGVGLVTTTAQRMDRGVDPDGNAWTPLSQAYARRKHGPGILRESLMLQRSVTFLAGAGYVIVGSNRRYAAIHQFGGRIEREPSEHTIYRKVKDGEFARNGRFVKKGASNFATTHYVGAYVIQMPARPYLGFGPKEVEVTLDVVETFTTRALKG
jgi:phage virion morphogenesis protein